MGPFAKERKTATATVTAASASPHADAREMPKKEDAGDLAATGDRQAQAQDEGKAAKHQQFTVCVQGQDEQVCVALDGTVRVGGGGLPDKSAREAPVAPVAAS